MTLTLLGSVLWMVITGFAFSLIVGTVVTSPTLRLLQRVGREGRPRPMTTGVIRFPGWLTGNIERLFFTLLVAADVSGAGTAMVGWIAVKMAAMWNARERAMLFPDELDPDAVQTILNDRFAALLTGIVSMTIAVLGGLIARGLLPPLKMLGIGTLVGIAALIADYTISRNYVEPTEIPPRP